MSSFIGFSSLTRSEFTSDEQIIIGCPTQEQIAVTITSLQLQPKTPKTSVSVSRSPSMDPPQTTTTPKASPPEKECSKVVNANADKVSNGEEKKEEEVPKVDNNVEAEQPKPAEVI